MRVCLEKSTGKLVEMQSDPRQGTLIQNAINAGYTQADVEEKEVTADEWAAIKEQWIDAPAREWQAQQEAARQEKEQAVKSKLGLSDDDWANLKDALSPT